MTPEEQLLRLLPRALAHELELLNRTVGEEVAGRFGYAVAQCLKAGASVEQLASVVGSMAETLPDTGGQ
jgi:hypothetical protein